MPEGRPSGAALEALIEVSSAIASRDQAAFDRALRQAERHAAPRDVDEVILQAHLFVGYPLALEAMRRWRELLPGDCAVEPEGKWKERGDDVFRKVYGSASERLLAVVEGLHPDLRSWMLENGYGRVIGRPQLDLVTRELCIAALLAVWDSPRQLHSHLRGALNAGATPGDVEGMLEVAARRLVPARIEQVMGVWEDVKEK